MPVATPHLLNASDPQWPQAGALANSASITAITSSPDLRDDNATIRAFLCTDVNEPSSASNALKSLAFMIISREANHAEIMRLHQVRTEPPGWGEGWAVGVSSLD